MSTTTLQETATYAATDATVLDAEGNEHHLSEYWTASDKGLALVFVRHFGCPFCKEHVANLIKHEAEFRAAGIDIIVVGNGSPQRAGVFSHDMGTSFPVLTDPSGAAYTAFGLEKAAKRDMFNPKILVGGIRAASKGYLPQRPDGDPLQLQGQFHIDPNGMIWHADRPHLMSDIPSATVLLDTARLLWAEQKGTILLRQ